MDYTTMQIITEIYSPNQCNIIGITEGTKWDALMTKIKNMIQKFIEWLKNLFVKFHESNAKKEYSNNAVINQLKIETIETAKLSPHKVIKHDYRDYSNYDNLNINTNWLNDECNRISNGVERVIDNIKDGDTVKEVKHLIAEFSFENPLVYNGTGYEKALHGITNLPVKISSGTNDNPDPRNDVYNALINYKWTPDEKEFSASDIDKLIKEIEGKDVEISKIHKVEIEFDNNLTALYTNICNDSKKFINKLMSKGFSEEESLNSIEIYSNHIGFLIRDATKIYNEVFYAALRLLDSKYSQDYYIIKAFNEAK